MSSDRIACISFRKNLSVKSDMCCVFDLDGVIVDSVGALFETYLAVLLRFGIAGARAEFDLLNGANLDEIVSHLVESHCLQEREEELRRAFLNGFVLLAERVTLFAGVREALGELKEGGARIGLASSSGREYVRRVLERFDIADFFNFVVSGDEVERAKPEPDIYNLARERGGCELCCAVEDSSNGARAALSAGLTVFFMNSSGLEGPPGISYEVKGVADVVEILRQEALVVCKGRSVALRRLSRNTDLSAAEEERIDALWASATERNPNLFNSEVANYVSHELSEDGLLTVCCSVMEYKHFLAQLMDKRLRLLRPLAVSGILFDARKRLLLGRRKGVSEYEGCFEFVPSGGIPPQYLHGALFCEQLKIELAEETGISSDAVVECAPFCFLYDKAHSVFDIGVRIELKGEIDLDELVSDEYDTFVVVEWGDLGRFFADNKIIPTSQALYASF